MAQYRLGGLTYGSTGGPAVSPLSIEEQRRRAGLPLGPQSTLEPLSTGVPEYDQSRIAGLAQEQMEPFYGELRRGLLSSKARRYSTPTAREGAIRAYTRGAFEALPGAQAGAASTARGLYQPEYAREFAEWQRLQREREEEEARAIRMATPISGGQTYRQAAAGMDTTRQTGGLTRPTDYRYAAPPSTRDPYEDYFQSLYGMSQGDFLRQQDLAASNWWA